MIQNRSSSSLAFYVFYILGLVLWMSAIVSRYSAIRWRSVLILVVKALIILGFDKSRFWVVSDRVRWFSISYAISSVLALVNPWLW